MLIPDRLVNGDTIGIISPSGAVTKNSKPQLKRGMEFLRELGFETELGKNALKIEDNSAGTPEQRAEDINSMFSNKEIAAIICSQGGTSANSCLPLTDFNVIRKNPKIFMGISDITVLLNGISTKTRLITFHGHDVM